MVVKKDSVYCDAHLTVTAGFLMFSIFFICFSIIFPLCATPTEPEPQEPKDPLLIIDQHGVGAECLYPSMNYVGTRTPGAQEFSLSRISFAAGLTHVEGMAPQTVKLNHMADQPNPLYDAPISAIFPSRHENPCIVRADEPYRLYVLDTLTSTSQQSLLMTDPIPDATGKPAGGILACATGRTSSDDITFSHYTLLAIKAHEGTFGEPDSGFAVVHHTVETITAEKKHAPDYTQVMHSYKNHLELVPGSAGTCARTCAEAAAAWNLQGGLAGIEPDHVVMCWNPYVERFYIGVNTINAPDATDSQGSCSIAVGRLYNDTLHVDPFIADRAVDAQVPCIALGANKRTHIERLVPFQTSTGCSYLLMVGTNHTPADAPSQVYAFALVHKGKLANRTEVMTDPVHGSCASHTSQMTPLYNTISKYHHPIKARFLDTPAHHPADIQTPAQYVGGYAHLPGPIADIKVVHDAVIVTVAHSTSTQPPGIFHSQPLFDGDGKIIAWTAWQRLLGSTLGIRALAPADHAYNFTYLLEGAPLCLVSSWFKDTKARHRGTDASQIGFAPLHPEDPQLYMLQDFPRNTPGLQHVSALFCAGPGYCALVETSAETPYGLRIHPEHIHPDDITFCTDDTIDIKPSGQIPARIVISGPVIESLGALQTAAIISDATYAWLCIGGPNGVAILSGSNGTGWSVTQGLQSGFVGLTHPLSFKRFSSFTGVQKILCCNNTLYILTAQTLYRMPLCADSVLDPEQYIEPLLDTESTGGTLFDFSVSPQGIIVGSSYGLLYAPITEMRAPYSNKVPWHAVPLPSYSACAYKIKCITPDHQLDWSAGAQLYVLTGLAHEKKTDIHRLFIAPTQTGQVCTIEPLIESQIGGKPGPWCSCNFYITDFALDGTNLFATTSGFSHYKSALYASSYSALNTIFVKYYLCTDIPLGIHKKDGITALVQNSATGNWLIAGTFGIRSNAGI